MDLTINFYFKIRNACIVLIKIRFDWCLASIFNLKLVDKKRIFGCFCHLWFQNVFDLVLILNFVYYQYREGLVEFLLLVVLG